jgi:hypothetical protein
MHLALLITAGLAAAAAVTVAALMKPSAPATKR